MLVGQGDLNRHGTFGAADVDHALVIPPRELGRDRHVPRPRLRAHRLGELREPLGVGVEHREEVVAFLCLVLWDAGPQALRQGAPEPIQPGVRHLQQATDV